MTGFFPVEDALDNQPQPGNACLCPNPDDQYYMDIDGGIVGLFHAACGRPPGPWNDDSFRMRPVAVTMNWVVEKDRRTGEIDDAYGVVTVNGIPDDVQTATDALIAKHVERDRAAAESTEDTALNEPQEA